MRVLFIVRPSVYERGGGDMTQALFTKRGLEEAGVHVDLAASLEPDARGYDVAHVFGVFDPEIAEPQMAACKRAGVPVALSPIWWDLYAFFGHSRACNRIMSGSERHIEERLERLGTTPSHRLLRRNETRKYHDRIKLQTRLMRAADVLLPNSYIDARHYFHQLRLEDRPTVVVPNPVDVPQPNPPSGPRSGIVCAARIEEKKNQAILLYALRDLDVEITLIGGSHQPEYMDICKRWIRPNVRVLGNVPHEETLRIMTRSAVHVLPSWAEIPGISSLEAAAAGARVIVSNNGTEVEYFGELADYVDPEDPRGIRAAVERALSRPAREPGDALYRKLEAYSVAQVAERTLAGYRLALAPF
ncbi:MAG TPA: glycosyltransferase family 4 protein [Candidatus Acidoferrales bacterium]|jgi:glycosyltransferase involved in cell wall biosynthesis|nr:glycosyltransferase family 4 protein [Candidatus Acidoferrales bacterium]